MQFKNKTILIIGGTSGIGLHVAKRLLAEGAFVIVTGRRFIDDMLTVKMDIRDIESTKQAIDDIALKYGTFDCVYINAGATGINNNGKIKWGATQLPPVEDWNDIFNTNARGTYYTAQYCIPYMNKKSSFIFTSSVAGSNVDPGGVLAVYGASKAALNYISKALCYQLLSKNIRVNTISPGPVDLDSNTTRSTSRLDRMSHLDDIADTVMFLASDNATHINGVDLTVDGGQWHRYRL